MPSLWMGKPPSFLVFATTILRNLLNSQKLAKFSEIIQILISKDTCNTLDLAEKQFHLTYNALRSLGYLKKKTLLSIILSHFSHKSIEVELSTCFQRQKNWADINVNPSVSPWWAEGRWESKAFWVCVHPFAKSWIFGSIQDGNTWLIPQRCSVCNWANGARSFSWSHPWQINSWTSGAVGSTGGCPAALGHSWGCRLHSVQGNRKMQLETGKWSCEFMFCWAETLRYWN